MIKSRLKVLCAERDITLSSLAREADVHRTSVYRLASLKEINSVNLSVLEAICATLDVQPGDILKWEPSRADEAE